MFDDLIGKKDEASGSKAAVLPPASQLSLGRDSFQPRYNKEDKRSETLSKQFEAKVSQLISKGRKRGRIYSVIGLSLSLVIFGAGVFFGYRILGQVKLFSAAVDESDDQSGLLAVIDPEERCGGNICCLASLEKIRKNHFQEISSTEECVFPLVKTVLHCEGSLAWCEAPDDSRQDQLIREVEGSEAERPETGKEQLLDSEVFSAEASSTQGVIGDIGLPGEDRLDSDGDGLTDKDELSYGTDKDNPDSDGDGYGDGDEVRGGYNPLGEGGLAIE